MNYQNIMGGMVNVAYNIIDLTHALNSNIPTWELSCGFNNTIRVDYDDCNSEVKFRIHNLSMFAGAGTHIDAPAHCIKDGTTVDKLNIKNLVVPLVIIDVSEHADENYLVTEKDIDLFENKYGLIDKESFVIVFTGWSQYWYNRVKYHNNYKFPSISEGAANRLLSRNIVGLGIDTLSPDRPESGYCVHKVILGSGKFIVENIADCSMVPCIGSTALILPIKIEGGTEAPIRLLALTAKR